MNCPLTYTTIFSELSHSFTPQVRTCAVAKTLVGGKMHGLGLTVLRSAVQSYVGSLQSKTVPEDTPDAAFTRQVLSFTKRPPQKEQPSIAALQNQLRRQHQGAADIKTG